MLKPVCRRTILPGEVVCQQFGVPVGRCSRLLDAAWSPDGRVLLLAFEGARQLAALHFTAEPPNLTAQLLPVQLPGLEAPFPQDAGAGGQALDVGVSEAA